VVVSEGLGPIRKRWKRSVEEIEGVVVGVPAGKTGDRQQKMFRLADIDPATLTAVTLPGVEGARSAITFVVHQGKNPVPAGLGYRHTLLLEAVEPLIEQLRADQRVGLFDDVNEHVPLLAAPADAATAASAMDALGERAWGGSQDQAAGVEDSEIPAQPAGSRCVLDMQDNGLTLTVPPAGIVKGSKGLFTFGLFWSLITMGIAVAFAMSAISGQGIGGGDLAGLLFAGLLLLVFSGIGIWMLIWSIHVGKRRAIFDVVGSSLVVSRQGLFGLKQDEMSADQIESIDLGPTGTKVNNKDINALVIHRGRSLGKLMLLSQLDDEEIRWIAAVLRVALGVGR